LEEWHDWKPYWAGLTMNEVLDDMRAASRRCTMITVIDLPAPPCGVDLPFQTGQIWARRAEISLGVEAFLDFHGYAPFLSNEDYNRSAQSKALFEDAKGGALIPTPH
jgi:hypothetical protein